MYRIVSPSDISTAQARSLWVDLDGTLVKSDTLVDSLLVLLRNRPRSLLGVPGRLLRGRAPLKAYVADLVALDAAHLPYNSNLLAYLQEEHERGRPIYLATGADQRLAHSVAHHLGIFSGVLGSDGTANLTSEKKLEALRQCVGAGEFDYVGNDLRDLPLLEQAAEAMVANPSLRLRLGLNARGISLAREFREGGNWLTSLLKAIRLQQWAKNLLIFLPLLLAHILTVQRVVASLVAFFCFSLTASATYIFNDLLDIEADRLHPRKRKRPFASGDLPVSAGLVLSAVFLLLAVAGAHFLPLRFFVWLVVYVISTLAYSLHLKRIAIVDVLLLAGLYTVRLLAGGAATQTPISHWLAGFAIFLFFSLAVAKRFAEMENLRARGAHPKNGRGYLIADLEQLRAFGTASAFAAVVIFANYISGRGVMELYRRPELLWLILPCIVLWLCWVWLLASRAELNEDPVIFALTDRLSLLIGAAVLVIALFAL